MRIFYIILLIFCTGLIFYLSGIPHFSIGTQGFLARKLGHSFLYGIFTYFLWMSVPWFGNKQIVKFLLCFLILLTVAVSDEYHQAFIPGRCGNINGVLFDLLGGFTVLSLISIRMYIKNRSPQGNISKQIDGGSS
jgi:VanZ like family